MDLGFPETRAITLREQLLRTKLRSKGDPCIELRRVLGHLTFFCMICRELFCGLTELNQHLEDELHVQSLATVQNTLLKTNPWPFNDGAFFFHADTDCHALVGPVSTAQSSHQIVIPGVRQKDKVSDLVVRHIGTGKISAKVCEKNGISSEILKIWCEWPVNKDFISRGFSYFPAHELAIVTFSYNEILVRQGFSGFKKFLPSSHPYSEYVDTGCLNDEDTKSFSDMEDTDEALSDQGFIYREVSIDQMLSGNDDQMVHSRFLWSKPMWKQLIEEKRDRYCFICDKKMYPGKDVSALLNMKTGKFLCSSRNSTGSVHVFHTSCLIQWILLWEVEAFKNPPEDKPRDKKKAKGNSGLKQEIFSAFCPECRGTGKAIRGDGIERPNCSTMAKTNTYMEKLIDGHKAWLLEPEVMENCSIGSYFPLESLEAYQEVVISLKSLHFFRADD